jgi:transposase
MSHKKQIPQKQDLERDYAVPGTSISALARKYNTSNPTVRKWLDTYDIPRKDHKSISSEVNKNISLKRKPAKVIFQNDWDALSIKEMESKYKVGQSTIYEWANEFGLPDRDLSKACTKAKAKQFADIQFDKETLESVYNQFHNIQLTADELGVSYSHVKTYLKKHNIETKKPWRSNAEIELFEYCQEQSPHLVWSHSDKSVINPFEVDIICHDLKLGIEYCGAYWHSETFGGKDRNYHQNKMQLMADKGYRLITIFEGDDIEKSKALIRTMVGSNKRVYARKTVVKEIEASCAMNFHKAHHMSGPCGARHHYALYLGDEIVMVLSMGKPRFKSPFDWECTRMTSHSDYTVVGGASKLFKHFSKIYPDDSIITFADLRFGQGKVYENCGFVRQKDTPPNYWYFHKYTSNTFESRVKYQKHKLTKLLEEYDPSITEYKNMLNNGFDRFWDCGNAVYINTSK